MSGAVYDSDQEGQAEKAERLEGWKAGRAGRDDTFERGR